ncbi:hypothetical protein CONCODRAFT_69130 [Conidiobolus coronatus NRRL 28638]|uniref:OB domain-containing protein n=1 Tax=Conidiobolus coronatus (strain ATCC 28846 / CBS 209.66 / NRRL 28638) TaxID=796925 RepID=A0A137PBG8_CONC2|nr:hypothetical protein CONCODRAFT_69130 [Conidiobolus coronatus NRRL 28638]|eukprot:KXN72345.1 hypothetical protein CONCODRAFT_69130 [Conidiobolus coronatus NRRL 28638]
MNANNVAKRLLIVDCLKIPINTSDFKLYQICGNLVCKVQKAEYYLLSFDDGTGVINCKIFKDEVYDSICEKLDFGDCCTIEGELISDYSSTQPIINVYRIVLTLISY